ncbi:MAG TPA: amidohydrolase family protein [Thermoanaerobaculia bacterium]|nr:amidohydrolase family protein [Thermoanaerobaculia bacterium]
MRSHALERTPSAIIPGVFSAFPVFDAHIHVGPFDQMNEAARRVMMGGRNDVDLLDRVRSSSDELLKAMDTQGIARAALVNSVAPEVTGITDVVNPWIARYVGEHHDRLVAIGGIHPRHSRDVAADMRRLLDVHRLGAIKLHPPHMELAANAYRTDCPSLADVYRLAGEAKRPVLIHTGTSIFPGARNVYADPLACDDVAVDFPETTIVLCHAGRPLWYDTAFFLLRRHSNVWVDVSSIPPKKLLDVFPRLPEVADRVLWGTDWPSKGVRSMRHSVEEFLSLPLSDEVKRKVLFDNAAAIFPG